MGDFEVRQPQAPDLPDTLSGVGVMPGGGAAISCAHVTGAKADAGAPEPDLSIGESVIEGCTLRGARWPGAKMIDVRLIKNDLTNASLSGSSFRRVEADTCRATGIDLSETRVADVTFRGCKLDVAAFHSTVFEVVRFEDCDLREADFERVVFTDVVFCKCDLRRARFGGVRLKGVDLRGSRIEGMVVDPERVRGAVIDAGQAIVMAQLVGLRVE